jgi:hypothetical protein
MAITEIKIVSRPSTSIPFFNQTDNAELTASKAIMGPFTWITNTETHQKSTNASGSIVVERTVSSDLLTQTNNITFDSLATWSMADTATGIALDREYFNYAAANGLTHPSSGQYTLTGIDAPFTCTTTYTYTANSEDAFFNNFTATLEVSDKLTSFTNTGSQLIAVHTYTNAADFTNNHWRDSSFTEYLHDNGFARTIEYALVSNDA